MTDPDFDPSRFSPVPMMSAVRIQRRYNPIAGLFEFFLGVKKPDDQVLEKGSDRPLVERYHTACSACGGRTRTVYYGPVMFGAYAGLVCSHCGAKVRVVDNELYRGLLAVTKPIWRPLEKALGPKLLERQRRKLQAAIEKGASAQRLAIAVRMGIVMAILIAVSTYFWLAPQGFGGLGPLPSSALAGAGAGMIAFIFYNFFRGIQ